MLRVLAIVFGLVIVLLGGGFLALGAYPPSPGVESVHQLVPADKLASPLP